MLLQLLFVLLNGDYSDHCGLNSKIQSFKIITSWIGLLNFIIIYASAFTPGYGYFIDEFYYIACANHPAFGYVDQPPIAAFVLFIYQFFFGDSVYAIRILPALAFSFTIIFSGLMTKQLGGNKSSQILTAICILA